MTTKIKSGPSRKIAAEDGERILEYVDRHPLTTSLQILENLNLNCCPRTVRNFLHTNAIHCRHPAKKIELHEHHAQARLNFAVQNVDRNWGCVIFTDEKVFSTSQDTRKLVWRPNGTRFERKHTVKVRRSSRISAAYWGWMSAAGPGELVRIDTRMNAEEYIRILEDVLLPSVRLLYPEPMPITLVQDNSAVHTSRVVRHWFEAHPDVEVLPWPAKSPDLNPIENLWAAMCQMWDRRDVATPRDRPSLHNHVTEIWENFRGKPICPNLIASMPGRLRQVIDHNGYWSKY